MWRQIYRCATELEMDHNQLANEPKRGAGGFDFLAPGGNRSNSFYAPSVAELHATIQEAESLQFPTSFPFASLLRAE